MMHHTNVGMTQAGFTALKLPFSAHLLEIGHGNAAHLPLLQQIAGLHYTGLEVSSLMQQEAMRLNQAAVAAHMAEFRHYDGKYRTLMNNRFANKITSPYNKFCIFTAVHFDSNRFCSIFVDWK